jgi:hypothetical protein
LPGYLLTRCSFFPLRKSVSRFPPDVFSLLLLLYYPSLPPVSLWLRSAWEVLNGFDPLSGQRAVPGNEPCRYIYHREFFQSLRDTVSRLNGTGHVPGKYGVTLRSDWLQVDLLLKLHTAVWVVRRCRRDSDREIIKNSETIKKWQCYFFPP